MDLTQLITYLQGIGLTAPLIIGEIALVSKYFLEPWQKKRIGMAETDVLIDREKRLAQANEAKQAIIDEQTRELPPSLKPLVVEEVRKQINLITILQKLAEDEVNPLTPEDFAGAKISEDWLYRWKNYAEKVSHQEIQMMWAKILKGEIKRPSSFSYRLMDFMDKLSQSDIEKIKELFGFVDIQNYVVFRGKDDIAYLAKQGKTKGWFQTMSELGVLNVATTGFVNVNTKLDLEKDNPFHLVYKNEILVIKPINEFKLSTLYYELSDIGKQLFSISQVETNFEYLVALRDSFISDGFDCEIVEKATYLNR